MNDLPRQHRGRLPRWQRIVGGAFVGLAVGFATTQLATTLMPGNSGLADLKPSQVAALIAGVIALAVGLICLAMSFSRRLYESENWTAESDPEEYRVVAPQLRLSAFAMLAMAAEFVALGLPVTPDRAVPVIAVVLLSFGVQLWTNLRAWQSGDELYRTVVIEGSAIGLGLVLMVLTLWAPLAIYGLVGFDPLTVILVVSLACIVPTIWLTVKRGMTE